MSAKMNTYLLRIVNQTDCPKEERQDMFDEMYDHLTLIKQTYVEQGYTEKEAEEMAMKEFGHEATIGDGLQQAMFPYRRELLLILALGSYLFVCVQYFSILFVENVANYWLFMPAIAHALILFFSLNKTYIVNRKLWLNLSLVLHLLLMFVFAFPHFNDGLSWHIVFYSILGGTIFLIYRTALTYSFGNSSVIKKRIIHTVNITIGFLLLIGIGFILFAFLLFGDLHPILLLNMSFPFIIWGIVYAIQIRLANKSSKWLNICYFLWIYALLYLAALIFPIYLPELLASDLNDLLFRVIYPIQIFD
ncbi:MULTISPECIES: permease prefix domain 1-containing protein [Bacillaceae]|uniref:Uncharacterized protein n=2 Tax=Bacillaceae TaxID=186817 RepID=A0A9D5DLV7_9BACI|nr:MULTISPECIES: permease prefix domain 1-containing protein [Bacillaceae]KQL56383.1 hypothetical protein AN965_13760 [Alkalicoccobacillus plakortidis]MBG9782707.1 hypothetical protein [Shouchella lehensis]TES47674.1 hypothetical protein E2L03_10930 [Shouchella lehensis]